MKPNSNLLNRIVILQVRKATTAFKSKRIFKTNFSGRVRHVPVLDKILFVHIYKIAYQTIAEAMKNPKIYVLSRHTRTKRRFYELVPLPFEETDSLKLSALTDCLSGSAKKETNYPQYDKNVLSPTKTS